jgi:hypothetical protein
MNIQELLEAMQVGAILRAEKWSNLYKRDYLMFRHN